MSNDIFTILPVGWKGTCAVCGTHDFREYSAGVSDKTAKRFVLCHSCGFCQDTISMLALTRMTTKNKLIEIRSAVEREINNAVKGSK